MHNGGNYGIWVWDEAGAVIEDCEISDCRGAGIIISGDTIEEARQMAASILADISKDQSLIDRELSGAHSNNMPGARAKNIPIIRGCSIFGGQDHGLWVHYKGRCLVEESRIFENRAAGVWIDERSEAALARSRVNHNQLEAIRVTGDSSASVEDCDLRENGKGAWAIEQGRRCAGSETRSKGRSRMNQMLKSGQTVRAESSGMACLVGKFLGAGGQGEVYRAELARQAGRAQVVLSAHSHGGVARIHRAADEERAAE